MCHGSSRTQRGNAGDSKAAERPGRRLARELIWAADGAVAVNDQGCSMIARDADSAEPARATRLAFDRYVLDLDRGCLLLDSDEVPLRPKTFAVLRYLVENTGRLVSKEDLFAVVWPNLAVTDDTLVQSIGELRRELGDDGSRMIKTIP